MGEKDFHDNEWDDAVMLHLIANKYSDIAIINELKSKYFLAVEGAQILARHRDIAEAALRDVIGMLDDPHGGEHVRDMRGATIIAQKALNALAKP